MILYDENGKVIGEIYEVVEINKISQDGVNLIKGFEGFRSNPYTDSVGVWTIGYGTTKYMNGSPVRSSDPSVSELDASLMLEKQINDIYGKAVNKNTTLMETQEQFDALTSFTYNLGEGNLKSSTLLKKHNNGDFVGASNEFLKWVYAGGNVIQGLVNRREKEKQVYLS